MNRDIETEKNRAEYVDRWLEVQVMDRPEAPRRPVLPLRTNARAGASASREPETTSLGDDFVNLLPREDYFVLSEPQDHFVGVVEEAPDPAAALPPQQSPVCPSVQGVYPAAGEGPNKSTQLQQPPLYPSVQGFYPPAGGNPGMAAHPFGAFAISNNFVCPPIGNLIATAQQTMEPRFIPFVGPFNIPPPHLPVTMVGGVPPTQVYAMNSCATMSADDFRKAQADWAKQLQQGPNVEPQTNLTPNFERRSKEGIVTAAENTSSPTNPIGRMIDDAVGQIQNRLDYVPVEANREEFRDGHFVNWRRNRSTEIRIGQSQIRFAHMSVDEIMKDRRFMDEFPVIAWIPSEEGCRSCIPCMDDFEIGDEVRLLPCFHRFHQKCIDIWFSQNQYRCPHCRWPLAEDRLMPQLLAFKQESE